MALESARTAQVIDAGAGHLRARLILAAMASGGALATNVQAQLAEALSHPSVRDAAVRSYDLLAANEAVLDDVLRARLVEAADVIVEHDWRRGGADEVAGVASAQRAKLLESEAARDGERV